MWMPGGNDGGDLLAADDVDAERGAGLDRRTELGDRVVIGDAEHAQADRGGSANQVHGADHPVTRERVRMNLGDAEPVGGAHASSRSAGSSIQCSGPPESALRRVNRDHLVARVVASRLIYSKQ